MTSMLSFVLENVPSEWESRSSSHYYNSYILFELRDKNTEEYRHVKTMFNSLNINRIQRLQNPFQYGRFKLRQEMLNSTSVETVFHVIHREDLDIALKYTCDYRRYNNSYASEINKHPRFYHDVHSAISTHSAILLNNDIRVLVVSKISGDTTTQSDYYIQYVVDFE